MSISNRNMIFIAILLYGIIGLFYSGTNFINHINTAIALSPLDQNYYMKAGDHFEQFYRYSLVKNNLERGNFPYYSGYQYNITNDSNNFTEGLIFFPFSLINGMLSFIVGDILSYNIMLLLSYVFTGLSAYLLVFYITKSSVASLVAGTFLVTVPFRTSFLYGQMVYGIDVCLLPLPILFTELALTTQKRRYYFLVGLSFFFLATANFQSFYWFVFLTWPYFLLRLISFINLRNIEIRHKLTLMTYMLPGLIAAIFYLIFIYFLLKGSVLHSGQAFAEVSVYAPNINNMFTVYNGNEKNLYLGWTLSLVILVLILSLIFRNIVSSLEKFFFYVFFVIFLLSYMFCFGPNIDIYSGSNFYKWLFENIPGFSGTRTPGRIMVVVVVSYAILIGISVHFFQKFLLQKIKRFGVYSSVMSALLILVSIVIDFDYLKPGLNFFEKENKVYQYLEGKEKILGLPFTEHGADFRNTPFIYYALKYNLRMYNGHSSFVPKEYFDVTPFLFSINHGELTDKQWLWLKENKFKYIVAHHSEDKNFRTPLDAILKLKASVFLDYKFTDQQAFLFEVRVNKKDKKEQEKLEARLIDELIEQSKLSGTNFIHYSGWYQREVYEGDIPFRWMHGNYSIVIFPLKEKQNDVLSMEFQFYCPLTDIDVGVTGSKIISQDRTVLPNSRWTNLKIFLGDFDKDYGKLEFFTPHVYTVPHESRQFGCQISDILLNNVHTQIDNILETPQQIVGAVGWHEKEPWGIWSTKKAEMQFGLPKECQNEPGCDLRLSFSVFNASADQPKVVKATINDRVETFTAMDGQVQQWRIPLDFAALNENTESIKLQLQIPDAQSPQSIGLSNDARVLGIGWHSYQFSLIPSLADCVPFQHTIQTADLTAECRDNVLSSGWYAQEPWGVWSSAQGQVRFDLPSACQEALVCDLSLDLKVFHASADKPKQVRALFHGEEIAQLKVTGNETRTWQIPLQSSLLQGRTRGLSLTLEVAAESPKALGESGDDRLLGVGLQSLGVVAVLDKADPAFGSTCFGLDKTVEMASTACDLGSILPEGWYAREADGVWSEARATLALQLPSACFVAPGCGLGVAFEVFNGDFDAPKTLTAYLHGQQLGQWSVPFGATEDNLVGAGRSQLLITLPFEQLQQDVSVNELVFVLEGAQSPSELGETDSRVLGFKLLNYTLMPNFWGQLLNE